MVNDYEKLINELANASRKAFGERLVGVYLHGSLAMGCFNPKKSDIDLLLITDGELAQSSKLSFMYEVVRLNSLAPKKGLELSVVDRKYLKPFVYPTPYELHFSPTHLDRFKSSPEEYVQNFHGTDVDLAAHVMITNRFGRVLYGEPIARVFGEVPREAYLAGIRCDIADARTDILHDPVYITLNLCRVAAFVSAELCLSKQGGGEWGGDNLPEEFVPLIREALACYLGEREFSFDSEKLAEFAEYMLGLFG